MIQRILNLMKENGYTGAKLAQELNASSTLVSDWKSGKSKPTIQHVIALVDLFNVSADYILFGKNPNNYIQTGNIANGNNNHATVTISNGPANTKTVELTDYEKELFRLYSVLNIRNKSELLTIAYKLEQQQKDGPHGN